MLYLRLKNNAIRSCVNHKFVLKFSNKFKKENRPVVCFVVVSCLETTKSGNKTVIFYCFIKRILLHHYSKKYSKKFHMAVFL